MDTNKKFVTILELLVITFFVMSVVPVCGLSDSSADIYAYPSIVNPGDEITVTFSGAPGFEWDWIAMYKVGDPNEEEYDRGYYLAGEKSGTLIFTVPDEPGDYEFRLFEDDGYTDITQSNVVRVQEGTSVSTPTPTALSSVHHLGDQTLSDWEVPKPEGTEYTTTFSLTAVPASADLILDVFDTDYNNPVLVNGNSIGFLCIHTSESWAQCTISIPGSALQIGLNTLTIQSESREGNYDDFMIRNIWVTPSSGVHHLGDQTLSDWEVPKPEGTEYTTTFSLTAVPASADLTLDVFDTDYNNPVLVNGNSVGFLCIHTSESWAQCTISIPGSALQIGLNTLTIQSESREGNYDDFMIRNIWVTPSSGVHHLGDQTLSDWEVPKPEGTEYTTTFSLTAVPASADLTLDVFDTDYNNPVLVNGNSVGFLCIHTSESWAQCTIKIPGSALRVGTNTLTIQSESREGNYDDFMIRNIWVTPSSDAKPTPTPTTECGTFWVGVQELWFDEHPESIIGELETFDFDNDGSEDRIVYTFEPEEVAEDLFLVRTIEFNKTDSELFEGKIVLKFENKGDKPIEYSHIEEIPKSFAESVDDLVFSIPPDEIIDPDPKVRWNMWRGMKHLPPLCCIAVDIHSQDYFGLVEMYYGILNFCVWECNKRSGTSRDYCLLLLAEEFKAAEPTYVCHEIENEDLKNLCLGRVTGDKKYCEKIKNEDLRKLCLGQEEEEEEEVTTTPSTAPTITIPPGVHHFGDQTFTDWEVQSPEGTEYTTTFSLATVPASADLTLNVFQTNYNNPVLVNGQEVGFLCIHSIESWKQCTISIPGSALQIGSNTLTIRAGRRGSNYDDFMIKP